MLGRWESAVNGSEGSWKYQDRQRNSGNVKRFGGLHAHFATFSPTRGWGGARRRSESPLTPVAEDEITPV